MAKMFSRAYLVGGTTPLMSSTYSASQDGIQVRKYMNQQEQVRFGMEGRFRADDPHLL